MSSDSLNDLVCILTKARNEYYSTGRSSLTDQQYDSLEETLRQRDANHPYFEKTQGDPSPLWKSAKHSIVMGSLNKVNSEEEFRKWASKFPGEIFTMQYKFDGLSLSEDYNNGIFKRAITRGDRMEAEGEDISLNVVRMRDFLQKSKTDHILPLDFSVRSEILLDKADFEKINSTLPENDRYSNPRNAAAGISRRLDGRFCKYLHLISYDVTFYQCCHPADEDQKIQILNKFGFIIPTQIKGDVEEMVKGFEQIKKLRQELPYDIDGVVVKVCSHKVQVEQGYVKNRPKAQIAWKFDPPGAATTFIEETWDVDRTGVVTPLAHLDPIMIEGSEIKKATLHNIAEIKRLGIGRGDLVMVVKRGDIIPKIESVIKHVGSPVQIPTHCPSCSHALTNDGTVLMCVNETCPRKNFNRILNWIKVTKIEQFGPSLVKALIETGKLNEFGDIYKLTKTDISSMEGWGESSAETIISNIEQSREMTQTTLLTAVGIPGISESTSEELLKNFGSIEKLFEITADDLMKIKGFAEISSKAAVEGLQQYKEEIQAVLPIMSVKIKKEGKLSGMLFCFTGKMIQPRGYYQGLVEANGGKNLSAVTKDLTYLVCNEDQGSNKSQKAQKYGVKVITEAEFTTMVGEQPTLIKKIESYNLFEE